MTKRIPTRRKKSNGVVIKARTTGNSVQPEKIVKKTSPVTYK